MMAFRRSLIFVFTLFGFISANVLFNTSAQSELPTVFDVRGAEGVPRGTTLRSPLPTQLRALASLQSALNTPLQVRYNGLTATPRHLFSYSAYLSPPSSASPESIARGFLSRNREVFRFSEGDLTNLKLVSRAYAADIG